MATMPKFVKNFTPRKLNARDKALMLTWVEALESGNYEQGTGSLMEFEDGTPQYCCLGVLGRVMNISADKLNQRSFLDGNLELRNSRQVQRLAKVPGFDVLDLNPVFTCLGVGEDGKGYSDNRASCLNDEKGLNFKQIAKIIRKEYGL